MEEYNIKQIFEEIENELILSMKRTLWWHKKDEKAKDFKWPQWQAMKLKQMEEKARNISISQVEQKIYEEIRNVVK